MSATLLFLGTPPTRNADGELYDESKYAPYLKPLVGNATVFVQYTPVSTIVEVVMYCNKRNITGVISTSVPLLLKLLAAIGNHKKSASLDNYQGSYFTHSGIEFTFISPLKQLQTVSYGAFIARRFISKFTTPEVWNSVPEFNWEIINATNADRIFDRYNTAVAIAVDIETVKEQLRIVCIGYTAIFISSDTGCITTHSCVLPVDSMYAVAIMRKFNWKLQAPKIFQNGKYDISYLSRYNAVPYNWLWDTATMFHSWYSELPKDLAFLGAFFVRKAMYWKDLADTPDMHEYYRYNALDHWTTALVFIEWMIQSPEWAKKNYRLEFPLNFPCHLSEMTGLKRDMEVLEAAEKAVDEQIAVAGARLDRMLAIPKGLTFNTNSAPQNARLRKVLGCEHITSSDAKSVKRLAAAHPINGAIFSIYAEIKKWRKLVSTYLRPGNELAGTSRILYSLVPHGTDTARMVSREHSFWCGINVQQILRGREVKCTIISDTDFRLAEADLKQAESRDVAYISGDAKLIAAVTSDRDFHAVNASAFFGISYEKIFDDIKQKTLDKPLRDLSKRTNHGATYLMGWQVLIETMGEASIWEAKRLLCLPRSYGLREVAEHLLAAFHRAYPTLATIYYPAVVHEVTTTRMLVSHANVRRPAVYGIVPSYQSDTEWELEPLEGWSRYCFGKPDKNKLDKNALVAHVSQSLNALALNEAYMQVFYQIAINPKYAQHFKLCAQIHDSILFQFRVGHEYLMDMVKELMQVPIRILGYDGVVRQFTVPADIKGGEDNMGASRWSETE